MDRRALCRLAASGVTSASLPSLLKPQPAAAAATESKEAKQVRDTVAALKSLLAEDNKAAFAASIEAGEATLPPAVPFTVFQKLEASSDPEFMEAAIDYAEAFRGAKDLVKLAKLTKEKVVVSKKEPGKPRVTEQIEYGQAEGSGLATAKEYAERAVQEVLGASLALEAAAKAMR